MQSILVRTTCTCSSYVVQRTVPSRRQFVVGAAAHLRESTTSTRLIIPVSLHERQHDHRPSYHHLYQQSRSFRARTDDKVHTRNHNDRKKPRATTNKTKKKSKAEGPSKTGSGRIVSYQKGGKSGNKPKVCRGCGTEVVNSSHSSSRILGGEEARNTSLYSKKHKARYSDVLDRSNAFLCQRCKALQSGNIWGAYDALRDVEPGVFNDQLRTIVHRRKFGLCLMVVDATDADFTLVRSLRKTVKGLPIILVVNKIDLLPRLTFGDLGFMRAKLERNLRYDNCFGVSAATGAGLVELAEYVLRNLGGRDVFCVGSANVGKSSLVQRLTPIIAGSVKLKGRDYRKRLDSLTSSDNIQVTCSHLPGTTLQAVRVPCFSSSRHALWDTPGIINGWSLGYSLFPAHLMEPLNVPSALSVPDYETRENICKVGAGESILLEANWMDVSDDTITINGDNIDDSSSANDRQRCCLARLDVLMGSSLECRLFLSPAISVRIVPTKAAPKEARIPPKYIQSVKSARMQGNQDSLQDEYTLPLSHFADATTSDKEWNDLGQYYGMDVTFASLGWLSLYHPEAFTVAPMVVKGSLWSKRRCLYPRALDRWLAENGKGYDDEAALLTDDVKRQIRGAAEDGKHLSNRRKDQAFIDDDDFEYTPYW